MNTQDFVLQEMKRVLEPLFSAAKQLPDLKGFQLILENLGLDVSLLQSDKLSSFLSSVQSIDQTIEAVQNDSSQVKQALTGLFILIKGLDIDQWTLPGSGQAIPSFRIKLMDHLLVRYVRTYHPFIHGLLVLHEIIIYGSREIDYALPQIRWDKIPAIFTHFNFLKTIYGWGTDSARLNLFIQRLTEWMRSFGFSPIYEELDQAEASLVPIDEGNVLIPRFLLDGGNSFRIQSMPANNPSHDNAGLAVLLGPVTFLKEEFEISAHWNLEIDCSSFAGVNCGFVIRPDGFSFELFNGTNSDLKAIFRLVRSSDTLLLGSQDSTYLSAKTIAVNAEMGLNPDDFSFAIEASLQNASLVLSAKEGDALIQQVLPQNPIQLNFDLILGVSSEKGFYIKGGAGFSYTFHLNKTLGPVFITTVDLELDVKDSEVTLLATASGGADIGPIHASLQKVGLKAAVDFGETDALSIDFKPPSGVGLTLDTQGLKGGGFLAIDPPIYFGIVNASFQDTFDLTIIGLIATQLPGGQPGFSMILSVLAEFQPIQLGFGFALNGVGGLIAIHRSMNEAALRETFNSHSLDLILFPRNPIRDITRILTAISSVFPAQQDHHTFGLMALISWGGSLVKGRLGILIELGGPGRIALMGQITAALPDESNQLVVLNMEILGFVDFGKQTLAIDATLYNSRVLIFAISGDMALRLNYSDTQADFALAVGGFFPGYSPTIEFPSLKRAMVGLDNDFATICFESYFAITSNSVQTGARLKLAAQWASIEIAGASGFDALIRFNPFSFETLFYIWVKVKFEGVSITSIDIRVHLTGPNPFHAYGYAEIGLFFFSVKVDFDATFGERNEEISTEISPFALLVLEAQDVKNVSFDIPNWAETGVVLKKTAEEKKILDPLGAIIFSQKTVPLKLELERFANVIPPENERYLDLTFASGAENEVRGKFAPAQFHDWSDQEKLAAPPFESFVNGKRLESSFVIGASPVEKEIRFETIVWEKERRIENAQSIKLDPFVKQALYAPSKLKSNPKHKKYVSVSTPLYTVTSAQSIDGKFKRESHLDMTYTEAKTWAAKWGSKDGVIRTKGFVAEDLQIPLGRR